MKKKINVSVVDIVGRMHHINTNQSTPSQSSNNSRASHQNLTHQSNKNSSQTNKKSSLLQFDSHFVNKQLAQEIEAANKLTQSIAKGEKFQNLLNMVKKYKNSRTNTNGFQNSQSSKTQTYFSKKCTPQNSGRGIPDYNVLHRSLQKLKEQDNVQPRRSKRTNSAPKKDKKVDYQNYISQNCVKLQEENEAKDKIPQQTFLKQKRKQQNISIVDNLKSQHKDQFRIEFEAALAKLNHDSHSHIRQIECFLNQKQLQVLLIEMNYLKNSQKLSQINIRNKYCQKIFSQLGGNVYGGVVSHNIQQFLRIIEGLKSQNILDYPSNSNQNGNHYIDQNLKLKISQKQRKAINSQYFSLRTHRILHLQTFKKKQASACQVNRIQYKNLSMLVRKDNKENFNHSHVKIQSNNPNFQKNRVCSGPQKKKVNKVAQVKCILQQKQCNAIQCLTEPYQGTKIMKNTQQQTKQIKTYKQAEIPKQIDQTINGYIAPQTKKQLSQLLIKDNVQNDILKRKPILSVDVNLGEGVTEKIIVYEGQSALQVANRLQQMFKIDENMKLKFQKMLQSHIRSLLWKIEEVSEQLISDRQ